ncbi:MAG: phosphocholine cytidylyltransferase family protein [bacterium]|nr:phosphocholine cytidylyltransferase family protein [bacterium]
MQAVILAAGVGTRLNREKNALPKGLIEIGGKPLLEHSLEALSSNGIIDLIMVVGFEHEKIRNWFGSRFRNLKIEYVLNENYAASGSMYSFALVQDFIEDEIILLESDLIYEPRAIHRLLNTDFKNCILVTALSGSGDEVFICANGKKEITDLGKEIALNRRKHAIGELAGISRYESDFLDFVFKKSRNDIAAGNFGYHYESVVFETSKSTGPVYALLADDLVWYEIDTEKDLTKAREQIYPMIKQNLQRYGE